MQVGLTIRVIKPIEHERIRGQRAANRDEQVEMATSTLMDYLAMVRTRTAKTKLKERAAEPVQTCCTCDAAADPGCRGKCRPCLNQFDYEKRKIGKACKTKTQARIAMDEYDQKEVDAGRIFPPRRGRKKVVRKKTA